MRFSVRQIMIAIAIFSIPLGLASSRSPGTTVVLLVVPAMVGYLFYGIARFRRLPPQVRIGCAMVVLCALISISAKVWGDGLYESQRQRCEVLARRASWAAADQSSLEARVALNRESAWFMSRAVALRRRESWIGLTYGPFLLSGGDPSCWDEVYELGLSEGMDMHEKAIELYDSPGPPAP